MESSIPLHLRCPRTRPTRCSEDYVPPYPAFTARFPATVTQVVMGCFGVQYRGDAGRAQAHATVRHWQSQLAHPAGADGLLHDVAHHVDAAGFDTLVLTLQAPAAEPFERWWAASGQQAWWDDAAREHEGVGYFREVIRPRSHQFETLLSYADGPAAGVARWAEGCSGPIREHGYWGSMRDRLPVGQTEGLRVTGRLGREEVSPHRVQVAGHDQLCLIRSGQDWSATGDAERLLYERDMQPVLADGMRFLSDPTGLAVGCYANRFLTQLDEHFQPVRRSCGLSAWRSLEHLERWSEAHPTHVAIFGTFMRMVTALQGPLALRLWHEVAVAAAQDQQYVYIGCHAGTGLLRGVTQEDPVRRI